MGGALLTPLHPWDGGLGPEPGSPRPLPTPSDADGHGLGRGGVGRGGGATTAALSPRPPPAVQGQQGPHGVRPDAPAQLPPGPGPAPHAGRRLLPAEQPAGRGPGRPPAPRPPPVAAPHPQPLLVDGGPFLRSVSAGGQEAQGEGGKAGLGSCHVLVWEAGEQRARPAPSDRCTLSPQAWGTRPCTRTCPPASPPRCPAPCPRSSPSPRTPPPSWSSCPRSPHPTAPPTRSVRASWARLLRAGCGEQV